MARDTSGGENRQVLITGASGAIGGALARVYAARGCDLILQGRDPSRLRRLAEACESVGASVASSAFDLTDIDETLSWCREICAQRLPDVVYANAGMNINTGGDRSGEDWHEVAQLIDLNVKSTLAVVHHAALAMRRRRRGQIAVMSSLAAFHGLPVTPAYSASKAAVKAYGEALRGWLAPSGVGVTVVMPGYVTSAMCREMPGPKPFEWLPDKAAEVIVRGVDRNRARISFPFPLNWGCWALGVLPSELSRRILSRLDYGGGR